MKYLFPVVVFVSLFLIQNEAKACNPFQQQFQGFQTQRFVQPQFFQRGLALNAGFGFRNQFLRQQVVVQRQPFFRQRAIIQRSRLVSPVFAPRIIQRQRVINRSQCLIF